MLNGSSIMFSRLVFAIGVLILAAGCEAPSREPYSLAGESGLAMKIASNGEDADTLVVLIHGAVSRGGPANYMYGLVGYLSARRSDIVVVALIRPGYYDDAGNHSPGNNYNRRDSTTPTNNAAIASEINRLKARYGARRVIAMGHSAGASTIGAILGRAPGLIDTAILVSCPCNIRRWRRQNGWRPFVRSESPSDFIDNVPLTTVVVAITGGDDGNTFSALGRDYAASLKARGVDARFIKVDGAGHSFRASLRSTTFDEIIRAIDG